MPTLNKYADRPGYYIRARPSSADAPITYQIESEAYPVIDSYGMQDGDKLAWSVIQSLKSLGLLYTNESGIIGPDEFEPDASQLEETALDAAAARRLARAIAKNLDVTESELRVILEILNIDPTTFESPDTTRTASSRFPTPPGYSPIPEFPVHDNIEVLAGETVYKTEDWWKGVILAAGYNGPDILVYLWRKNGDAWKRKQKYKVAVKDWKSERSIINELVSQAV